MSITVGTKFFDVKLDFPTDTGVMHWSTQVAAEDEEGAVKLATSAFWAQMDFKGIKPNVHVANVFEVEAHLADPLLSHEDSQEEA